LSKTKNPLACYTLLEGDYLIEDEAIRDEMRFSIFKLFAVIVISIVDHIADTISFSKTEIFDIEI